MNESESTPSDIPAPDDLRPLEAIDVRQDDVLRRLDVLNQDVLALLNEFTTRLSVGDEAA